MDTTGSSNSVATASINYTINTSSTVPVIALDIDNVRLIIAALYRNEPVGAEWHLLDRLEYWLEQIEGSRP